MSYEGFLLVDKPVGITSFQVIRRLRKLISIAKIGHAGTLDPFASGLLIVGIGKAFTRRLASIQSFSKRYIVKAVCGIKTNTGDCFGRLIEKDDGLSKLHSNQRDLFLKKVSENLPAFLGKQVQIPPLYSAKKKEGVPYYRLARQGKYPDRLPHSIEIFNLRLLEARWLSFPILELEIQCSKGTYIRTLVEDIAKTLNTVAYSKNLIRTHIGDFSLKCSVKYDALSPQVISQHGVCPFQNEP